MESERWTAMVVLGVLGLGLLVLGAFGWSGRLRYKLGELTEDDVDSASWDRAHRCLGRWFVLAGVATLVGGLVVMVAPTGAIGPVMVATTAMLVLVAWVGVAAAFVELDP